MNLKTRPEILLAKAAMSISLSYVLTLSLTATRAAPALIPIKELSNTNALTISNSLSWDADTKEFKPQPGDIEARFTFFVTNISLGSIVITNVERSCGCTEASMPTQPWNLAPGESGAIKAAIDLRGKAGFIRKWLKVHTPAGIKELWLEVNIPAAAPSPSESPDRLRNQQTAAADRQAVFRGECAKCHAEPATGLLGAALHKVVCAICHEAENRAAMVPDLKRPGHPTGAEYWKQWIGDGKPGSLMPAFAEINGGPLSNEQIDSLVEWLRTNNQ